MYIGISYNEYIGLAGAAAGVSTFTATGGSLSVAAGVLSASLSSLKLDSVRCPPSLRLAEACPLPQGASAAAWQILPGQLGVSHDFNKCTLPLVFSGCSLYNTDV